MPRGRQRVVIVLLVMALLLLVPACRTESDSQTLRPRQLRDVPASKLAFNFKPDVQTPSNLASDEAKRAPAIQQDFDSKRQNDALLRTVMSPDGQRALALYNTADQPTTTFRIDLYSADGNFIRNVTPPTLAVVFQDSVAWSADSSMIAFVGRRNAEAQPSPTPPDFEPEPVLPSVSPVPTPTIGPAFAPLAVFSTEQVYICNRDGYELRPLTARDGLIYFGLTWAPDGHALAALACKESEWDAREKEFKTPAGRPRVIATDGVERLLDDQLAETPPVWSPDSSKVAAAFGSDIGIYDAAGKTPTQARIKLNETLLTASAVYEEKLPGKKVESTKPDQSANSPAQAFHASFNPIVRLEWPTPEKMYFETAYIRLFNEPVHTWSRWHLVTFSPQAAVLKK
jgi:hypothetical protein